jgi:hypothetical protein
LKQRIRIAEIPVNGDKGSVNAGESWLLPFITPSEQGDFIFCPTLLDSLRFALIYFVITFLPLFTLELYYLPF